MFRYYGKYFSIGLDPKPKSQIDDPAWYIRIKEVLRNKIFPKLAFLVWTENLSSLHTLSGDKMLHANPPSTCWSCKFLRVMPAREFKQKNRWIMNIESKEAAVTAFSRELARWYDFDYKLISLKLYFPSPAPSLSQHFPSASFFFVHCVPKLAKRKLLQIFRLLHRLCNQWCRKSTDVDPDIIFTTKVYYSHNKKRSWLEIQSAIGFKRLEVTKSRETLNSGCQ